MIQDSEPSEAERAEIARACERTALAYAHASDFRVMEELGAQFTEDAEFHLWGEVHAGRVAIRRMLVDRDPEIETVHTLSNFRIDVKSADEAEATVYVTAHVGAPQEQGPPVLHTIIRGMYRDSYRRVGTEWLIARREYRDLMAPQVLPAPD